jgi:Tfp pilus assembly protein PilV
MRTAAIERSQAGFGIVSVLVAIVLIAIGVVALSSSSAFMVSLQTDAAERTRASAIALAYMEQVKTRLPTSIATEAEVAVNETGTEATGGRFLRSLTVVEEPDTPDAVRATVEVQYPSGFGRRRTLELVTVIYVGNE